VAFADDERSQRAGDIVELYEFTGPLLTHRYTSSTKDEIHNGHVFTPLADLSNSGPGSTSSADTPAMEVTMPVTATVVVANGLGIPPRSLRFRLYRRQARSQEVETLWDGQVLSITPIGRRAKLRSVSQLGERLATNIPSVTIQKQCNHFLGDARCRVDLESMASTVLVSGISGNVITLNSAPAGIAQWYVAGKMKRLADGEEREILAQVGASAVMTISSQFPTLGNGDEVRIYPGCNHYITTCQAKFNNKDNFGGHPSIPESNPWYTPINLGSV
jgi:hypothetical protein